MLNKIMTSMLVMTSVAVWADSGYTVYSSDTGFYVMDANDAYQQQEAQTRSPTLPSQQVYVSVKTGYKQRDFDATSMGQNKKTDDEVFELSGAIGLETHTPVGNVRTELEASYNSHGKRQAQFTSGSTLADTQKLTVRNLKSNTLFLNAYYDMFPSWVVSPYIGGGVGVSQNRLKTQLETMTGTMNHEAWKYRLAWNAVAGVSVHCSDAVDLDMGYRYLDPGRFATSVKATGTAVSLESPSNTVTLGMRYKF